MHSSLDTTRRSIGTLATVKGRVITADDADYDKARTVFYGNVDKRPSAIVQVADAADVAQVIAAAREGGHELAIRSGGHSLMGHGTTDGGLVIDLRAMSRVEIDPAERIAWAETGATALEVTEAATKHGLVIGFGDAGSVGVSGISLGGGIGFLVRKHGLTIDSLLGAEVVTADGRLLHVDLDHHRDLFWAIRGGGGNFGVATHLKFRLHEMKRFTGGMLVLPATVDTIAGFAAAGLEAPEALSVIGNIMPAPPMPFLPASVHGQLVLLGFIAYAGDDDAAAKAIAPFRALATPHADLVKPMPYPAMYPPEDPSMHPMAVSRTLFLDAFDRSTAEMIVAHLAKADGFRVAQLRPLGGAVRRVADDATAYNHRARPMLMNVAAFYTTPAEKAARLGWVKEFHRALQPNDDAGYVGFLSDDQDRVRAAYPGGTWDRMRKIKADYDPTNLFRLNQNIPPATA
jgi:FAD/FMN-containing dehydrogenase